MLLLTYGHTAVKYFLTGDTVVRSGCLWGKKQDKLERSFYFLLGFAIKKKKKEKNQFHAFTFKQYKQKTRTWYTL